MNSYFTNVPSYMQPVNPQEQQGLMPVFQNMAAQQQNQNAALAQQNQLVQQAGQTAQSGRMNPMAMAAMLRGKKPNDGITNQSTGVAYDANGQNPYAYAPQGPDYSNVGNVFSTRD